MNNDIKKRFPNNSFAMQEQVPKPLNPSVDTLPREFLIEMYNNLLERNQKILQHQKNRIEKILNDTGEKIEDIINMMQIHQDKHNQYLKPFILELEGVYNEMYDGWKLFNLEDWEQLSEKEYTEADDWQKASREALDDWTDVDCSALSGWEVDDQEDDFDKMDEIIEILQDMKSILQEGFGFNIDQQWFQPRQNKLDVIIDLLEKIVDQNNINLPNFPDYKKIDVHWDVKRG